MSLKKNLDQLVYEQLRARIIKGEWEQGLQLDVDALAAEYEVSRTPVLQALKRMQNEGMLVVSGVGKFYFPKYTAQQVRDLCRIRLVLELEALEEIQSRNLPLDLRELRRTSMLCLRSMENGDTVESRRQDLDWHKQLVAAAGNDSLTGLFTLVQGRFMVANYLQVYHSSEQQRIAAEDHEGIMDALERGDFIAARQILSVHITDASDKICSRIQLSEHASA